MTFHSYRIADGHGLRHDPLKAIVAPRPIGWISTRSPDGVANLAPYSFFNMIGDTPPMLAFSSSGRKDSLRNAEASGEFAWNLATRPLAEAMNRTSAPVDAAIDEFALAGLTPAPCLAIAAPRVAQSPATLECRVTRIIQLPTLDETLSDQWLTVGQVVAVHIREALIVDGLFDMAAAQPILRAGYVADYAAIDAAAMFRMRRPGRDEV